MINGFKWLDDYSRNITERIVRNLNFLFLNKN